MMRERPENDTTHEADWLGEDGLDEREPLLSALTDDGARWRAEHGATVEKLAQRLEGALPRSRAGARRRRRAWWRTPWVGVVGAAVVLMGFAATLLAVHAWQPPHLVGYPPPRIFSWAAAGNYAPTAQEAFAMGLKVTPCTRDPGATMRQGAPPQSMSVTWLFTSDNYGMVRIFWTCKSQWNHEAVYALVLARNSANAPWWIRQGAPLEPPISTGNQAAPPPWLALPPDTYQTLDFFKYSRNDTPAVSAEVWYSPTLTYVLGHSNDTVTRPANATAVHIAGHTGWATDVNGYVTVTVPLADGTTAFFSGNGSLEYVESLATSAIAHMNTELLPLGAP